jgi:hypothetical protein
MPARQLMTEGLHGVFRDVLRDRRGSVTWDSGWRANTIVGDCRRLLAGFMRGTPTASVGIQGLQVGVGDPAWDVNFQPATATQIALVDAHPFTVARADLAFNYLTGGVISATPTNRLQVFASLGPGTPPWPDAFHTSLTLREFGLVAQLDGTTSLVNYVRHPAIVKDPASTLERTVWLVF